MTEIKLYDEIKLKNVVGYVTYISERLYHIIDSNGRVDMIPRDVQWCKDNIELTNRSFPQLKEVFEKMKNEENNNE